ncbi:OGA GlcNAcase, partial [Spelaeornis formosus]|nr:OGA GlcNAcase [Elachura formosa]
PLTLEEVRMLVELFYLPYHHGALAQELLEHFRWLRANSLSVGVPPTAPDACGGTRWRGRAQSFQALCARTCRLHSRLVSTAGRALLYDLHPYLWDIRNMLLAVCAFVLWLGTWLRAALAAPITPLQTQAQHRGTPHARSLGRWRVGVSATHPTDLGFQCPAGVPSMVSTRGLKVGLSGCCPAGHEGGSCSEVSQGLQAQLSRAPGRLLGSFLSLSPEYTFVLEDEGGPCGYAAGALHAEGFLQQRDSSWLPAIRHKYPPDLGTGGSALGQ